MATKKENENNNCLNVYFWKNDVSGLNLPTQTKLTQTLPSHSTRDLSEKSKWALLVSTNFNSVVPLLKRSSMELLPLQSAVAADQEGFSMVEILSAEAPVDSSSLKDILTICMVEIGSSRTSRLPAGTGSSAFS